MLLKKYYFFSDLEIGKKRLLFLSIITIIESRKYNMEITGKIIQILPEEKGEGRNGTWRKQNIILETQDQYPKKVCIAVWGDKIDLKNFNLNETVTASINIESREFNNKWYTDVKAWKIMKAQQEGGPVSSAGPMTENIPHETELPPEASDSFDDLPF